MEHLREQQLDRDKRLLEEKIRQYVEQLTKCQNDHHNQKTNWDAERQRLQSENTQIREELTNFRSELRQSRLESDRQSSKYQLELEHLQKTSQLYQERSNELQNLAERRQKKIAELEQQLIAGTQTTAASPVGGDENYSAFLKQQLSEQIETVRSLEKRNRQLASELRVFKAKRQNVELLSEENISLKSQIDRLQQSLQKSGAVDLENIRMKDELNQWKNIIAKELLGVDPATVNLINISKNITEFQRRHQADMTRLQAALRSADEKQQKLSDMDTQLDQLQEQTNSLESTRMEQVGAIKRLEQQVRLCVKESQFLKEQLRSYDQEETELMNGGYDQQKSMRIKQLEELVDELKNQAGLDQLSSFEDRDLIIRSLQEEKRQLQSDLRAVNQELVNYEKALGQGGYDAHRLRVLHLADNPASRAFADTQQLINQLKAENASLRADGTVNSRSSAAEDAAPAELSRQLQAAEKRLQRLREMFALKIDELREAIAAVLGYRWDLRDDGFDLLSVYTMGDASKSLRFTKISGPEAEEISRLFEHYVGGCGSIAAFLCDLNLRFWELGTGNQRLRN